MKLRRLLLIPVMLLALDACSKVPVGEVGIKVSRLGSDKGVSQEVLGTGYYYIGFTEDLYTFPTYIQNYVWSKSPHEGSPNDESISFQTREGLSVNADIGIAFQVQPDKVPALFQQFKKGLDEIRDVNLRNTVRDAFINAASTRPIESIYGEGRADLIKTVQDQVTKEVAPLGIVIDHISWVGELRLPGPVVDSINNKIQATQKAQQIENEIASAKAEAAKTVAKAQGEADSILLTAQAQAKANDILSRSLTPELLQIKAIEKWNGNMPQVMGSSTTPLLNLGNLGTK